MGSCAIHPIAYAMGPVRRWTCVRKGEHGIRKVKGERGRAPPGPVAVSWQVPWKRALRKQQRMVPPQVWLHRTNATLSFAYADPETCRWGNLRAKGGHRSHFEIFSNSNGGWRAVGRFRRSEPALFKMPRDIPAEGLIEEVGWCQRIRRAQKEGEGTALPSVGASECEHRPKDTTSAGLYIDGGISNRCLKDAAADDGAVICCCINSVKTSRRFSYRVENFRWIFASCPPLLPNLGSGLGGSPGEWPRQLIPLIFHKNTGGNAVNCFFGTFLVVFGSRKFNSWSSDFLR